MPLNNIRRTALLLCLLCVAAVLPAGPAGAQAPSQAELKAALRDLLKDNPDLVLDVLRENSETVLEIAQQGNILRTRKALLAQWAEDAKTPKKPNLEGRALRGKASAPVTVVAYSDFTCPYCRRAEGTLVQLVEKYGDKMRIAFKALPRDDVPISQTAARYAAAALMQNPEKGWKFHDEIFANIELVERDGEPYLKALAVRSGLDIKRLLADSSGNKVRDMLAADKEEADNLGITGTPCFLVNDLVVRGAVSKEFFEEAIQMALRLKSK